MATEQSSQHQHAQWLASFASGHFVQNPSISSLAKSGSVTEDVSVTGEGANQTDSSQSATETTRVIDMSTHSVVKLITDPSVPTVVQPAATGSPFNLRKNLKKRKIDQDEAERQEEYKLIRSKDRVSSKTFDMRRPVRPIDRQKMRPWLKNLLDTGSVFGLNWIQKEDGIFQISWRHASRLGWNLETDGDVFERWARHTGIFKDGDEPEPKRWKANFRCALHSLPDVKELTSPTDRKGRNASRTYRFLRPNEVQPPVKRKQRYNIQIPYTYERPGSEDSGSQQADSDERNTDEEAPVPEQVQSFPHCDHDYAIKVGRFGEQTTSEILSKHNSGYVLIKSKEANEFEFRLTQPQNIVQPSSTKKVTPPSKSSSPQKKGKGSKKKPTSGSTPSKRGKGKVGQKNVALKKDGKQMKKVKSSDEKEASPSTKVSLKALLSGRSSSGKRAKGVQGSSPAAKKIQKGKKTLGAAVKGKGTKEKTDGEAGAPAQTQGLDALLEAANQIECMETLTSGSATAPTNTSSRAVSKQPATQPTVAVPLPSSSAPVIEPTTTHHMVSSVTAPIVLTSHPMVAATGTTGAPFTPIPVLTSAHPATAPTTLPSQVPLNMLHKYLGLSVMPTVPTSAVTVTYMPVQTLMSAVSAQPETAQPSEATSSQVVQSSNNRATVMNSNVENPIATSVASTSLTQPERTSMLKHLLRLTAPTKSTSAMTSIPSQVSTTPVSHIIPAAPQVPSPLLVSSSKECNVPDPVTIKIESEGIVVGDRRETDEKTVGSHSGQNSFSTVVESEMSSAQNTSRIEIEDKGFPYIHVSMSKDNIKSEPVEVRGTSCDSGTVDNISASVSSSAVNTASLQNLMDGPQPAVPSPHMSGQAPSGTSQTPSSISQVPQCLPQTSTGLQYQQASGSATQTMTLTLPPGVVSALQGQSSSSGTFTQPMDLLQFLNFFAATGNGQVIIKTEAPVPSDVAAMNNAYSPEKAANTSQQAGDATLAPKVIFVDTSLQQPAALSTAPSENPPESVGRQEAMSVVNPALPASVGSSVLSNSVDSYALSASNTSPVLAATVSSLSAACEAGSISTSVVRPAEMSSAHGAEEVNNQYIVNEADISSLTEDQQGTDRFVVEDMLM